LLAYYTAKNGGKATQQQIGSDQDDLPDSATHRDAGTAAATVLDLARVQPGIWIEAHGGDLQCMADA
jgi:hypothetical protein